MLTFIAIIVIAIIGGTAGYFAVDMMCGNDEE